jgi:hypothetical protein
MKRVALALLALSLVTGCGKIREKLAEKAAEKAVETASGGDVKISGGGSSVTVKDKNGGGTATLGTGAKLPDGWPSDVPVYPDATITAAMAAPTGKTVVLETKDPAAKVADFYKSKLSSFQKMSDVDMGGTRQLGFRDGKRNIAVLVAPGGSDGKSTISLSVQGG